MFLQKENFHILKTDWLYKKTEADIIAQKDGAQIEYLPDAF